MNFDSLKLSPLEILLGTDPMSAKSQFAEVFDLTGAIWQVAQNICQNVIDVAHIDMNQVAIDYVRCKTGQPHGTLATLTPLRFENGRQSMKVEGQTLIAQQVFDQSGREVLYLLTVYVPRFTSLDYREKLVTLAHELWHISEEFNGDLRRFAGRYYAHGGSEKDFDLQAERIIQRWQATDPPNELTDFLRLDLDGLVHQYGRVIGQKFTKQKMLSVENHC